MTYSADLALFSQWKATQPQMSRQELRNLLISNITQTVQELSGSTSSIVELDLIRILNSIKSTNADPAPKDFILSVPSQSPYLIFNENLNRRSIYVQSSYSSNGILHLEYLSDTVWHPLQDILPGGNYYEAMPLDVCTYAIRAITTTFPIIAYAWEV